METFAQCHVPVHTNNEIYMLYKNKDLWHFFKERIYYIAKYIDIDVWNAHHRFLRFLGKRKKLSRHSIHIRTNVQRIDFTTVSFPFFMRGNPLNDSSPQALSLSFLSSSQIAGFPTFTRLSNSFAMKSVVSEGSFKTIEFALKQRDLLAQKFLVHEFYARS